MIVDNIRNASLYYGISPRIATALQYLETQDLTNMEPGKYEISGDECYMTIADYDTKPCEEKRWEAHRRYIDIQYIANGKEMIGYSDITTMQAATDYDTTKDIIWLEGRGDLILATVGTFFIFYPDDAHKPGVAVDDKPELLRKVVVKVLV